jgi:putative transposase
VCDNGPEFAGKALDRWAYERGITLQFIRPGKPVQNACCESFNAKLRDESLNANWFASLADAQRVIEQWRQECNDVRPHKSLGRRTPTEFTKALHNETLSPTRRLMA